MVSTSGAEDDHGGYQESQFDTGSLAPPVRANYAPMTSAFDTAPVRAIPPVRAAAPQTAAFDNPPVRGVAPPPITEDFEAGAPRQGEGKVGLLWGAVGTPLPFALVAADVVLRSLTSVCLLIALALLAVFTSDVDSSWGITTASPKYALAVSVLGIIYSIFELVSAIIRMATGKLMLPQKSSHLISYIGDQVFMCLFLTAGSAGASYLIQAQCASQEANICSKGEGGVAMIFFAFAFIASSYIISTFCIYKKKT